MYWNKWELLSLILFYQTNEGYLLKSKQNRKYQRVQLKACCNMMALAWQDKRTILMLSTKYSNKMIKYNPSKMIMVTLCNYYNDDMYNNGLVFTIFYVNRRSTDSTKEKPLVVHEYNHYMLGVDKLDQLMSYYSFLCKSIKWWRKVFFWITEVVVVNQYIIYQDTNKGNTHRMTHLRF